MLKATSSAASVSRPSSSASRISTVRPRGAQSFRLFFSPSATIARFSSTKGTTSATVPSAASPTACTRKVRNASLTFLAPLACWHSAQANLKATPDPLRLGQGYL